MPCPPTLSLQVLYLEKFQKNDVCHVLREVLFMLDVTHSQVDVETELVWYHWILLVYFFSFKK